jgi:exosortase/archaeosortase family protein
MDYYPTLILRILTPFILSYELLSKFILPLTLNTSYYIYRLFDPQIFLIDNYLITFNNSILFTPACAAISAYFFLLLLTVFTKDIKFLIRLKIFLIGSLTLFIVNIIRILVLIFVLERSGLSSFEQTHNFFWIFFGSLIVALIWIYLTKYYKIKSIPLYSDLKYLLKQINAFKH